MKLNKKINSWMLTSLIEITLAFVITHFFLWDLPSINNAATFWNMGLFYIMLLFSMVLFFEFMLKINWLSNETNVFKNILISLGAALFFGFLFAIDVYSWKSNNIAISVILVVTFSAIIIFLYTWFNFEMYIRRNDRIPFKKYYSRMSMTLYIKFFFTSWVYYDDIVIKHNDKVDLNNSHSLIVTNNFIYSITLSEKGNETFSFVDGKRDTRLNKEVEDKEKDLKEYLKAISLDNSEDVLINLIVAKDEHYAPVIKGRPDRQYLISDLRGITKKILEFEKSADDLGKLVDREYLMDVISEDRL